MGNWLTFAHKINLKKGVSGTAQMVINRQMDKQNVVYSEILFSLKKYGNSDKCCNMGGPWRYYTKWNNSVTENQIQYDSAYMRYLE